jgi:hypothetical protein
MSSIRELFISYMKQSWYKGKCRDFWDIYCWFYRTRCPEISNLPTYLNSTNITHYIHEFNAQQLASVVKLIRLMLGSIPARGHTVVAFFTAAPVRSNKCIKFPLEIPIYKKKNKTRGILDKCKFVQNTRSSHSMWNGYCPYKVKDSIFHK